MSELTGKILDRKYKLIRKIGEGGMGSVWIGEHVVLNRKVAVKVMHAEFSKKPQSVERFFLEAQTASSIGHPNIVEIYDVGQETDGTVYIVMELLKGRSLKDALNEHKRLPPSRAIAVILQVLSALHAAHLKGIIHRDLKPDNVFLAIDAHGREEIKLLDFGVAKFQGDTPMDLSLTKTGVVLGTPNYLAPEQARGQRDIDARIDIWSAGVMLYEILAGRLPFEGETYNEVMGLILLEEPPPISQFTNDVVPAIQSVVMQALAKNRDERFSSMVQMIEALTPYMESAEVLMSESAVHALRTTIPPPPFQPRTTRASAVRDSSISAVQATMADDGIVRATAGPGAPRTPTEQPAFEDEGLSIGNKAALAAVVLLAGSLLILILVFFLGGQTVSNIPTEKKGIALSEVVDDLPTIASPVADTSEQVDTAATGAVDEKTDVDTGQGKVEPAQITITLKNLPPDAKVTLDGKEVSVPIAVTKAESAIKLAVSAPGYKEYKTSVVPSEDRELQISMTKSKKRGIIRKKRSKRKRRKKKDDWGTNPFGK